LVKIRFDELLFIQSKGEYVQYRSTASNTMSLQSLKQLETVLPESQFMRVHKSFIVNLQKIDAVRLLR
ncbi:MAG: LytR/AlgR family response regulator transcription factor, partial [Candidatus Promineifilaceae bacterium]